MRKMMFLAAFAFVACGKGAEGDACAADADCADGLFCDLGTATDATEGVCADAGTGTDTDTMDTDTMDTDAM